MDDKTLESVSFLVYDSSQTRSDRVIHRLIIALLIAVLLLFASNALWLWAWTQYDYSSQEFAVTQDGRGVNIIGSQNGVDYGTDTESQEKDSN